MTILQSPFKAYVRWRHSRGYGVHSPFAYNLVKMAVKPGDYGFYGYEDIDNAIQSPGFKGYHRVRKDARLLLRLLVCLGCSRLVLPEGLPALKAAADGADIRHAVFRKKSVPAPRKGDFLVSTEGVTGQDILSTYLDAGVPVMAIEPDPETARLLYKACKKGLIFHGTRLIVAIPRQEMAFVAYTMKF